MRIQVVSDLHNEVLRHVTGDEPPDVPEAGADVLVLGGDIDRGRCGVEWAAEQGRRLGIPVIYVAGNHEFYGSHYPGLLEELRDATLGTWVHVLEREAVTLDGVRFLGATLWTDFAGDGHIPAARSMPVAGELMPDYRCIRTGTEDAVLTPEETRQRHRETREWLYRNLASGSSVPTVVVTHAAPLLDCAHPGHPMDELAAAFVSDLHPLLAETGPALWIHGHTHANIDLYHCGVRVVSNQRGYPDETVPGEPFDPTRIVEVPA